MGQCDILSFQPVGQWMGYLFTDLGAKGCCRSLNASFLFLRYFWYPMNTENGMCILEFRSLYEYTIYNFAVSWKNSFISLWGPLNHTPHNMMKSSTKILTVFTCSALFGNDSNKMMVATPTQWSRCIFSRRPADSSCSWPFFARDYI